MFCFSISAYFYALALFFAPKQAGPREKKICIVIFSLQSLCLLSLQTGLEGVKGDTKNDSARCGALVLENAFHVIHKTRLSAALKHERTLHTTQAHQMTSSQHGCQPLEAWKKNERTSNKKKALIPFFSPMPSIFHLLISIPLALLMNFYFTSQQVTSGLMPVYIKVLVQVTSE